VDFGCGLQRQAHREATAATRWIVHLQPAAEHVGAFTNAQQAVAAFVLRRCGGEADAVVANGEHELAAHLAHLDADRAASGGLGLTGMRERIELLGGTFEVRTAPGAGTTVRARVPVTEAKA